MTDRDRQPIDMQTPIVPPATAGGKGALPFVVAGLLVVVLAVGYFAMDMQVLKAPDQARVPESGIDVTTQQPAPVAPVAPLTPAEPRP